MAEHFGPEWMWDQERPEAIRARAQMQESYKRLFGVQHTQLAAREVPGTFEDSAAKHFRLAARHLWLGLCGCLHKPGMRANSDAALQDREAAYDSYLNWKWGEH